MSRQVEYTVTFLEMSARPSAPVPPQPRNVGALALMRVDAPTVHFFTYLYATVGAAYHWTDFFALSADAQIDYVCDPKLELYVLYRGGAPAGFFQLDFREGDVCDLAYFGLFPETVGAKLGPWLLSAAIAEAWTPTREPTIQRMTVNTCTLDHPAALGVYQRVGFEPIRREVRTRLVGDATA